MSTSQRAHSSEELPPGEWHCYRHDRRLSGHQPLPGAIVDPVVRARAFLGGPVYDAWTWPVGDRHDLFLLFGGVLHRYDCAGSLRWQSDALGLEALIGIHDLDLDGRTEVVTTNGKSLFILDADSGTVLWSEYLGPPFAGGFMPTGVLVHHFPEIGAGLQVVVGLLSSCEVALYDFTPGCRSPRRVHLFWMNDFFHPSILAFDIDGDGRDELVVTKYSAVYVFDPLSGALKSECRWSSGGTPKRNYGLFQAHRLGERGELDLVVVSDRVSKHIAVVANSGGRLANRWDRFIEHIYPTDHKELHYVFDSIHDVDHDGRLEIAVSTFNDAGDGRWWLELHDALTGEVRSRRADRYLHGIVDLGGRALMATSLQTRRTVERFSTIELIEWKGTDWEVVWACDHARWPGRFRRTGALATFFRSDLPPADDLWSVEIDGVPTLLYQLESGELRLLRKEDVGFTGATVQFDGVIEAVVAVVDLDGDRRSELLVSTLGGQLVAVRTDGSTLFSMKTGMRLRYGTGAYYMAKPMQAPVFVRDNEHGLLIVPDGGTAIHALEPLQGRLSERWRHAGRGTIGPEEAHHSVSLAVSNGAPVVVASEIGGEHGALVAIGLDGEVQERWELPGLPAGESLPAARIGVHEYLTIPRDGTSYMIVSGYRSGSMNSEVIGAIDHAGAEIWSLESIGSGDDGRGAGPWNSASISREGHLAFLAKDTVCILDPLTGRFLVEPWQLRPYNTAELKRRGMTMDDFAAYGSLVPLDVDGDGVDEWLILANYGGIGLIDHNGTMSWWRSAPLSSLTNGFAGVADVDGDGRYELGVSSADGDFVCMEAATGFERWRLHLGEVASDVVTCDIDGDGQVEFVLATREGSVYAIGVARNGCGIVKWRLRLGYSLGPPIVADIDGEGTSEVVVVSGDGHVYVIGDRRASRFGA